MNKIKEILKRYLLALIFLIIVVLMMLLGTLGVMEFGNNMLDEIGVEMKPRGVHLSTNSTI